MAERAVIGALAGPSHSPGVMSGRPGAVSGQRPGEPGGKGTKRGKGGPERGEARQRGQAALAVQGAIAAGTAFTHFCFGERSKACTQQAFCSAGSSENGSCAPACVPGIVQDPSQTHEAAHFQS